MARKEPKIESEQLEDMYLAKGYSIARIASILNCSVTKIHYWLLEYGIKRRKEFKKNLKINKGILVELYAKQKLSLSEIAKKFDCNNTNILYWMKKFNIKRRPANQNYIHIPNRILKDLYWDKGLTTSEIAKRFGIKNRRTIHKKLVKSGIETKTVSQALTKKKKIPFQGGLNEKAYFLGLRTGDFYAKWMKKSIRIQTTTTHSAQINLLKNSFDNYSETCIYLSKNRNRDDEWFIYTDLHPSFSFLIQKPNKIPTWVLENNDYFYNFLAAYSDCEGSFDIIKSHRNSVRFIFRIKSGDKEILEQMKMKLESENYKPRFYLYNVKGKIGSYGKYRKNMYDLTLYRKNEVLSLVNKLLPLSKHSEKIRKIMLMLKNKDKDWSEISESLDILKREIEGELLKNQPSKN